MTRQRSGRVEPPTFRRQFNQSFYSPDGNFSITKTIAIAGQVMVLFHAGRSFDTLILHETSLFICLSVLIAPDLAKKLMTMWFNKMTPK